MADMVEKILNGLRHCMPWTEQDGILTCDTCPYYRCDGSVTLSAELVEDIRKLLKEQQETIDGLVVLQKVMETVEPVPDYNVRYWRCPKCNWLLTGMIDDQCSIPNRRDNYCSSCGRPLKWQ